MTGIAICCCGSPVGKVAFCWMAYSDELGVTPTHLTRALKAATGKTASDVLTERVLHAARCLLEETKQPAKDIARHLGFGSAAYFTRFIQQHTGQTPSQLRG